jgi:hypothetical protein
MSVLDSIKGLFQKQVNPAIFGFFAPSAMPKMGEKEYLQAYRGWAHACVNAIAQRISEIEVNLEKKDKDSWKAIDAHPALSSSALDNRPAVYYSGAYGAWPKRRSI